MATKFKITGIGTLTMEEFQALSERRKPTAAEYKFAEEYLTNGGNFHRALKAAYPEATEWPTRKRNTAINRLVHTRAVNDLLRAGMHEACRRQSGSEVADRIFGCK